MDIALTLRCMDIVGISNYVFLVEPANIVGDIRYRSVIVDSIAVARATVRQGRVIAKRLMYATPRSRDLTVVPLSECISMLAA